MSKIPLCAVIMFFPGITCCWGGSVCTAPVKPDMPSASADSMEMDRASNEINDYMKQMGDYRSCLVKMVNEADADMAAVIDGWNYTVKQYAATRKGGEGKTSHGE